MTRNIGTKDRLIRLAIAMALLVLAWEVNSWIALFFALFTLFEVFSSWCILYQFIGKNSCPVVRATPLPEKKDEQN
ncbi:MAG: DUF2892 domain-containing protein [Candidatus Protochlamydia sp.]|nr:DUF2892 domain-containing protein [Candidatus Protochlamydia sp.]